MPFETFEDFVKHCAENDKPDMIENASIEHALIIVKHLLDAARRHGEDVRIVSGRLLQSFYSELAGKATAIMDEGVKIGVVVLDKSDAELQDNDFYNAIKDHDNGDVKVVSNKTAIHFVVSGIHRYRVEVDDEKKKAIVSFNDATIGKLLGSIYDSLNSATSAAHGQ